MLYYISTPEIKILVVSFIAVMLYAGLLTVFIPRRAWMSSLAMALLFGVTYFTLIASSALLGKPLWTQDERVGQLGGYISFDHDGKKWIAVLMKTPSGPELIAVPHKGETEAELNDSMNRFIKNGQGQIVRKPAGGTMSSDKAKQGNKDNQNRQGQEGDLEFYEFNENYLEPKAH